MYRAVAAAVVVAVSVAVGLAQDTSSALISQALDQPVKLELNTTLPRAMDSITKQTGVRITEQAAVWELLPWGRETNITAKIENQTLRQAIDAISRKLGLVAVLKDEAVELQPMPALRRLGRRATIQELQALDLLTGTSMGLKADRLPLKELVDAVDQKLVELKSPYAVEFRPGENARLDQAVSVPRNATMAEALESIHKDTALTWYPWGKSIVIVPKEDQIRTQLAKTISTGYNGEDIAQVLSELSQRAGVQFDIEPGAIQAIPPESRVVRLQLSNTPISQALDTISGFTGLGWVVKAHGVYIWNQAKPPVPARDPIVAIITLPDSGTQVLVPQSQVSPELREYLKQKAQKELDKLQQMMKEEGFKPTTRPSGTNTTKPDNEDL